MVRRSVPMVAYFFVRKIMKMTSLPPWALWLGAALFATTSSSLSAASLPVPNASFEDPDRTGLSPAYSSGNPAGWTFTSGVNGGIEEIRDARFGTSGAEGSRLTALGGDGDQVGFINIGNSGTGSATSEIVTTIEPNTTYTLTVSLGQRASGDRLPDGRIGLWADGIPLGTPLTYVSTEVASGGFKDLVYTWNSPPADDPLIGASLQVRFDFSYSAAAGGWQQAQFDKVRLETQPFVPTNRYYWDLNGATAGAGGGGSPAGAWDATSTHWTTASAGDGPAVAWSAGGDAVFAAGDQAVGAYTVSLSGTPQATSLTVRSGLVTLSGGALELVNEARLSVQESASLTVQSVLSGTAGLKTEGTGDLTLAGGNNYSGPTRLAGLVRIQGGNALPDGSPVEVAGTLTLEADETLGELSGAGIIDLTDRTLSFGGPDGGTFSGKFVGAGNLVKQGAGTTTLAAQASAIEGTLTIGGGVVNLATPNYQRALGASTGIVVNSGGTLRLSSTNVLHVDRGAEHTPVTVNPGGTVELNAPHNHFGTLFLNGGTVTGIGNGMHRNEYTTLDESVTVRGTQGSRINRTTAGSFALTGPAVLFDVGTTGEPLGADLLIEAPLADSETPGSGGIVKSGPGTLVLAVDSTYTGPTAVEAGALKVKGALASPAISVASGATLDFSELGAPFNLAPAGTLSGAGTVLGTVDLAGTLSPGAPLGKLTFDDELTLFSGATYRWETGSWSTASVPGEGHDSIAVPTLVFFFDGAPLRIQIAAATLAGFTEEDRSFTIAHAANGITGFAAADIDLDASEFAGATGATGTWSIEATGADLVLHYHAGTGLSPYQTWANSFASLTDRAPATDFDRDGIDNLGEFAFNGEPTRGAQRGLISGGVATVGDTPQVLTLSVAVREGAAFAAAGNRLTAVRDGVTYTIEAGVDLATWGTLSVIEVTTPEAAAIQGELTEPDPGWEYHTFRVTGSTSAAARGFIRAVAGTAP